MRTVQSLWLRFEIFLLTVLEARKKRTSEFTFHRLRVGWLRRRRFTRGCIPARSAPVEAAWHCLSAPALWHVRQSAGASVLVLIRLGELNAAAEALSAAYVVMGAYGHTRLREAVLGGATRDMLHEGKVPLLMAH